MSDSIVSIVNVNIVIDWLSVGPSDPDFEPTTNNFVHAVKHCVSCMFLYFLSHPKSFYSAGYYISSMYLAMVLLLLLLSSETSMHANSSQDKVF